MDGFITIMREKCINENIIGSLHILLHADDTVVLSTSRNQFIYKCNTLINEFTLKKLSLNLSKSGFMIISPDSEADRCNIQLNSGWLKYKVNFTYLGAIFSDQGTVNHDLNLHVHSKNKSVYIKLANFVRNNSYAPLGVKKKVLNTCLTAAILYGCETWSSTSLHELETLYRKAIKITFSIRKSTPSEVVYIETGFNELKAEIYKRQHKFWSKILSNI